jgi:hypothetical protein
MPLECIALCRTILQKRLARLLPTDQRRNLVAAVVLGYGLWGDAYQLGEVGTEVVVCGKGAETMMRIFLGRSKRCS